MQVDCRLLDYLLVAPRTLTRLEGFSSIADHEALCHIRHTLLNDLVKLVPECSLLSDDPYACLLARAKQAIQREVTRGEVVVRSGTIPEVEDVQFQTSLRFLSAHYTAGVLEASDSLVQHFTDDNPVSIRLRCRIDGTLDDGVQVALDERAAIGWLVLPSASLAYSSQTIADRHIEPHRHTV